MEKRAAVAELCCHKTNFLNLNYLYAQFIQDASEVSADNDEHGGEDDNDDLFSRKSLGWMKKGGNVRVRIRHLTTQI